MIKNNDSILQAFETLDRIWSRDRVPWYLERHYFLYCFAVHQGDIDEIARALEAHRNTIQFHFMRFGFSEKSEYLRHLWEELVKKSKTGSFESKFFKFYRLHEMNHDLSSYENKILIRLWQTGFSFKTIGAHYMLWALRHQKSKEWIEKKLGYSSQHCMRILVTLLDPRSDNGRWLAPLRPRSDEIYARGPRNHLMKARAVERGVAVSA